MRKEDIQYEVTELTRINSDLRNSVNESEMKANMMRVYYNMCDLLSEADYADAAETIIQVIEQHEEQKMSKDDVVQHVSVLIETMQEDLIKPDESSKMKSVCEEIGTVCSNIAGIISREAKTAWGDIGKTIKQQDMPECSGMISEVRKIPGRVERNLKKGIKKWLKDDQQ